MGSKRRIVKHILPTMIEEAERLGVTTWWEPFVGGANMIDKVPTKFKRIGSDINAHTIQALIGIRDFVNILPENVSEEDYNKLKGSCPDPITSWIRFVCSYGGKFENGYARQGNNLKYRSTPCEEGLRNAQKQSHKLQGIDFLNLSYEEMGHHEGWLIYCDPPYKNVTSYKTEIFDHEKFWNWCREMSKKNLVFISEYSAPEDFKCIWSGDIKTNFASQRASATHLAKEKLFKI